ncbi:MAG TPA: UDP-N-acetylmuramoyl-tripeptide--D-alanyl-D-alanine ligase [Candidatus Aphodocola excrementigallinarum]|uniref:UDP-N-acetylmuramoyl-tripeptide--D-alanyl-D-alanine ligase n=1 Tax=Candidatus Aphodocola excrementigallinarum TaxID=2840670 RepID=A0A9D1IN95_9FIRM|nr:UDP-N-acetylmuramoyl-tripeptide--D-alanyl-D-alanine ligase [Candidatus Aphodocola excrementigallinarum]
MFYISLIPFIVLLIYDFKKSLHMAQQNLYNDDKRFLKWTIKDFSALKTPFKCSLVVLITYLILVIFRLDSKVITSIYFLVVCLIILILKIKENKNSDVKISLKVTARVKRLIFTNVILFLILVFALSFIKSINIIYLLLFLYDLLINFVVMISIIINKPVEKLVYLSYKNKAVKKLKDMKNLKVIGITGSYGKTSSKNILSDILNVKYNALPSPKNFNTPYGLIITVNNHLDKFDDILIAEMGAYKVGEIKELCDLVKPKYGILTKIGTAHIEIFGSQENIQKGKFELIESLPHDGIGVLNADDKLQVDYKLKNDCKIIWIGIENKDADVRAVDIKTSNKGTTFNVIFKGDKKKYEFTTKLLGYNNVYNILASLALAKEFGLSIDQMKKAVSGVRSVEHRLELRKAGNITYIDDSYNSNPVGSKMALEVLKEMPGLRIVMTPGMVELGDKSYELNKAFGTYMKDSTDKVILVGKKITKPILDGLKEVKYNDKNIYVVKSTKEAFSLVKSLTGNKEAYVLIENDLPDIYNE